MPPLAPRNQGRGIVWTLTVEGEHGLKSFVPYMSFLPTLGSSHCYFPRDLRKYKAAWLWGLRKEEKTGRVQQKSQIMYFKAKTRPVYLSLAPTS